MFIFFFACLVIATISFFIFVAYQHILLFFVFLILIVLGFVLPFKFPFKWDNIQIETRGGKILEYSVPEGKGKDQMELIESKKREILGI